MRDAVCQIEGVNVARRRGSLGEGRDSIDALWTASAVSTQHCAFVAVFGLTPSRRREKNDRVIAER